MDMLNAAFFCAGVVVGLAASIPILTIFWLIAHKAAQMKAKGDLLTAQVQAMNAKKRVDSSIEKLRAGNPEMTREQEAIARSHFEETFISRYQGQRSPDERVNPISRD